MWDSQHWQQDKGSKLVCKEEEALIKTITVGILTLRKNFSVAFPKKHWLNVLYKEYLLYKELNTVLGSIKWNLLLYLGNDTYALVLNAKKSIRVSK